MVYKTHSRRQGYASAGQSSNESYSCTMEAELGTLNLVTEEAPPRLAQHGRGIIQGIFGTRILEGLQEGFERGRQRNCEGAGLSAFGLCEGDCLQFEINILQGDLGVGLTAAGVDSDLEANLHPPFPVFKSFPDLGDILVGQFGFLLGVFFGYPKPVTGIGGDILEPDGLAHNDAENLDVVQSGVELDRTPSAFSICGTPVKIVNGALIRELAWNRNAVFAQVEAKPTPSQRVAVKSSGAFGVAFEKGWNPVFPALCKAVGCAVVFLGAEFCLKGASLLMLGRIILTKLGALKLPLARFRVDKLNPPVGRVFPVNEGCHMAKRTIRTKWHQIQNCYTLKDSQL